MYRRRHMNRHTFSNTVQFILSQKKIASIFFDPENSPSGIFPLEITEDIPRDFVYEDVYQATT